MVASTKLAGAFVFPTDPTTAHVHANLTRPSWLAYFMGVLLVGICDVSYTFLLMTSGIIQLNVASVSGPIIWLLAAIITPFGMPTSIRTFVREVI